MHQVTADGFHFAADNICGLEILAKDPPLSLRRRTQVTGKKDCLYQPNKASNAAPSFQVLSESIYPTDSQKVKS